MNAEELIEELFEMVEKAWSPPSLAGILCWTPTR